MNEDIDMDPYQQEHCLDNYPSFRDSLNEKPFSYVSHYGTSFDSSRCDFKEGLVIEMTKGLSTQHYTSDIMEMIGHHATNIHPHLNGFQGYDCVKIDFV